MAPKSQDDPKDDDSRRGVGDPVSGDLGTSDDASRSGRAADAPLDFGAFVSQSVRSSAERFKQGSKRSPSSEPPAGREAPPPRKSSRSAPSERPARYWRDSVREQQGEKPASDAGTSQRFIGRQGEREDRRQDFETTDGEGGGFVGWLQGLTGGGDGEGPNRSMIGYFLLGLLVMLLVIFLLVRIFGGGDDGDEDVVETPVPTQIVAPGSGPDTTDVTPGETPLAEEGDDAGTSTETPEIQRGGDNVLGGSDRESIEGTPETRREDGDVPESPLAKECSDRCLIRVQSDQVTKTLEKTGNRPSFAADDVAWVVATPKQISVLDEDAEVDLVQDSADTLYLYVITVPQGGDSGMLNDYGTVLDDAGAYRLVQFEKIPARVTTLTNKGFDVAKVAPAPPPDPASYGSRPALGDSSAGELMGQISDGNMRSIIADMQASGSNDGSGVGTRYYTKAGNQVAADYLFKRLESFGLRVWYEDFLTPDGILLVNVIAEVPGKNPDAVYAIMAHLDSINEETSPDEAPGADDNATGMAVTLEIARILAQYELDSPVRFVFVNAEEVGILGSSVWSKRANAEGVPIDGVLNVDSVGSDRQGPLLVLNSDASSAWLQDLLISTNSAYGLGQEIMSRQNPSIIADDNMVRAEGINAVMIARELYGWSPLHHSPRDLSGQVSMENVLSTAYLMLLSIVELAK